MNAAIILRILLKAIRITHKAINDSEKAGHPVIHELIVETILEGVRYGERSAARDLIDDEEFKKGLLLILGGIRVIRKASIGR